MSFTQHFFLSIEHTCVLFIEQRHFFLIEHTVYMGAKMPAKPVYTRAGRHFFWCPLLTDYQDKKKPKHRHQKRQPEREFTPLSRLSFSMQIVFRFCLKKAHQKRGSYSLFRCADTIFMAYVAFEHIHRPPNTAVYTCKYKYGIFLFFLYVTQLRSANWLSRGESVPWQPISRAVAIEQAMGDEGNEQKLFPTPITYSILPRATASLVHRYRCLGSKGVS